jgi:hypothetical protein
MSPKTMHRKLKIEQHEPHENLIVSSCFSNTFYWPFWLQHVVGILKDDTKCCVVFDGKGLCVTLF